MAVTGTPRSQRKMLVIVYLLVRVSCLFSRPGACSAWRAALCRRQFKTRAYDAGFLECLRPPGCRRLAPETGLGRAGHPSPI